MEGYLIRIPRDAWLGGRDSSDSSSSCSRRGASSKKRASQAQLLYYVLGEGYLRGYASPDDDEPVDTFQLTSFHVQVDPMYSMLMFEVFATAKIKGAIPATANDKRSKASKDDSSDDSDSDDSADPGANGGKPAAQEPSILLFAPNKTIIQTWGTRVLNWNRYVFGSFGNGSSADDDSDERDTTALEASRLELLAAFQQHQSASWFSRPLTLKTTELQVETAANGSRSKTGAGMTLTSFSSHSGPLPATPMKVTDDSEGGLKPATAPSKPWWMLNASQTRRISSNSLRK